MMIVPITSDATLRAAKDKLYHMNRAAGFMQQAIDNLDITGPGFAHLSAQIVTPHLDLKAQIASLDDQIAVYEDAQDKTVVQFPQRRAV